MTTDKVYVFKGFQADCLILAKSMEEALRIWRRQNERKKHVDPDKVECMGRAYTRDDE